MFSSLSQIITEKESELAQLQHASADATRQKEVLEFLASMELEIERTIKAAIQQAESDATASIERARVGMNEQLRQREEEIFIAARSMIEEEWSAREDCLRGKFQAVLSSELEIQHDKLVSQFEAIVQQKDVAMKADEEEIKHRIHEIEEEHQCKMGEMHKKLEEVAEEICRKVGTAADARIAHSLSIADAQCTARDEQISMLLEERVELQNLLSAKDVLLEKSNREASNRRMFQVEEISEIIKEASNLATDHDQMKKAYHQMKSENELLRREVYQSKMECKALRGKYREQREKVNSFDYEKRRYESRVGELSACKQLLDRQMEDLKQENSDLTTVSEGLNKRIVELARNNQESSDKINVLTNRDSEMQQKYHELDRKHNATIAQISSLEQERRDYARLIEDGMKQNSKLLAETLEKNGPKSMSEPMVVHLRGNILGDKANMNESLSNECSSLRSEVLRLSKENFLLESEMTRMKKEGQEHQNDSKYHSVREGLEIEAEHDLLKQENNSLKTILSMMRKEMETAGETKDSEGSGKSSMPSDLTLEQQLTQCRLYLDILLKTRDPTDCRRHGFIGDEVEFLRSKYRDLHRTADALREDNSRLHRMLDRSSVYNDHSDPTGREKELIQKLEEATDEIETLLTENEKLTKVSNELRFELNDIKGRLKPGSTSSHGNGMTREHEQKMLDAIMGDQSRSCGSSPCSPRKDIESEVACIGKKPPMTYAAESRSKTACTFRPRTESYIERKKKEIEIKKKKIAVEKAKIRNWNVKDRTTNPYL